MTKGPPTTDRGGQEVRGYSADICVKVNRKRLKLQAKVLGRGLQFRVREMSIYFGIVV